MQHRTRAGGISQGAALVKKKAEKKAQPKKLSQAEIAVLSEREKKFDPNATADACIGDLRNVQERNPLKHITRNFYRIHGAYSDATWNQFFGTFLEFRRQAGLELSRNQHSLERKIAKHASLDVYRDFYTEVVLPYHEKHDKHKKSGGRFQTLLYGSDFHDMECDPFVLSVFIDTARRLQPDIISLGGDVFDLYEFSRFSIDPRQVKIVDRFRFVKTHIFGALRRACPDSQIDLIVGNHEFRILKLLADKTPAMRILLSDVMGLSLNDVFGVDEFDINLVAKLDLAAFSAEDSKDELRENFKVYHDALVVTHFKDLGFGISGLSGHTHRPSQEIFVNVPMGRCSWTNAGCIAETRAEYVDSRDKWANSFAIAHIDTQTKSVQVEHIIVPKDHVVVHGKRYERVKKKPNY
jgi:hypothetical protein